MPTNQIKPNGNKLATTSNYLFHNEIANGAFHTCKSRSHDVSTSDCRQILTATDLKSTCNRYVITANHRWRFLKPLFVLSNKRNWSRNTAYHTGPTVRYRITHTHTNTSTVQGKKIGNAIIHYCLSHKRLTASNAACTTPEKVSKGRDWILRLS